MSAKSTPLRLTEVAIVRRLYPQGGSQAVQRELGCSIGRIYYIAKKFKIKREGNPNLNPGYPEGTISTITQNGRTYKRIKKDGKMQLLHRVVWEEANGPIPKGSKIFFIDGDSLNCELDNLKMI